MPVGLAVVPKPIELVISPAAVATESDVKDISVGEATTGGCT